MSRIAYVNGRYLPHAAARVHVEDRGYQFSDGVYEVVGIRNGRFLDLDWHNERLARSLAELRIDLPMSFPALNAVLAEVMRRNRVRDGIVYLQVTRGVARRDHGFPDPGVRPALVVTARTATFPSREKVEAGLKVASVPDLRWARRDIKTVSLLPNVLAKQAAREAGAYEAWQVDADGMVTEGSSTNAWIVTAEGRLVTRPAGSEILNGITRLRILELARERGLEVEERAFSLEEAKKAREAFLSSTTSYVMPVVEIDGVVLGNGKAGSIALQLRDLYEGFIAGHTADAAA